MTGQQSDTQWYIARNGKQHGPLSDVEMRTFVAQGHLKPTDLIWRPGFTDWRPAPAVFPFPSPEAPPPPPQRTGPPGGSTQPSRQSPALGAGAPGTTGPAASGPGSLGGPGGQLGQGPQGGPQGGSQGGPLGGGPQGHRPQGPGAHDRGPGPQGHGGDPSFEPKRIRVAQGGGRERSGGGKKVALVLLLLVLIGGGAGYYLLQGGGLSLPGSGDSSSDSTTAALTAQPPDSPAMSGASSSGDVQQQAQALDAKYQQTPIWSVVKREFPDWYSDRLREVATLTAENKPQDEINKHLAQSLVQLRRKHAKDALSASTGKLKVVANAFLDNLKSLSQRSVTACYGFISQGETSPVVLDLLQSPEQGAAVQAQVAAIFEAIAEGRKSPTTHDRAVKQDYAVLVQELSKLGWKETDLKTFSNPSALAREPPGRVCQMVQDWFVAHLAVQDQDTQERLLVETLKPVVSG